jgi:hypothetical protein
MESIFTSLTPVSFAYKAADIITSASGAKNMPFFPAEFFKEQTSFIFSFCNKLKGFLILWHHYTTYNLVPKVL